VITSDIASLIRGERGRAELDSGSSYGDGGRPVRVFVRKRPGWFDLSDDARGVAEAGKPRGWLAAAEAVVRDLDLNVNRRGVVFVSSPARSDPRWLQSLADRVADASLAVYEALLELEE
jgi:hypothetical protein